MVGKSVERDIDAVVGREVLLGSGRVLQQIDPIRRQTEPHKSFHAGLPHCGIAEALAFDTQAARGQLEENPTPKRQHRVHDLGEVVETPECHMPRSEARSGRNVGARRRAAHKSKPHLPVAPNSPSQNHRPLPRDRP